MKLCITIPGRPITKKNSQRIVYTGKYYKLLPSKQYKAYEEAAGRYLSKGLSPIDCKVNVQCIYYMPTRHKVDLTNLLEATDDILVKYGILSDDNSNIVASHDGSRVLYDKENPRVEILITPVGAAISRPPRKENKS